MKGFDAKGTSVSTKRVGRSILPDAYQLSSSVRIQLHTPAQQIEIWKNQMLFCPLIPHFWLAMKVDECQNQMLLCPLILVPQFAGDEGL